MDKVSHFEIPTDDKARSRDFYSKVFEWQNADVPVQMSGGTGTYTIAMIAATDPAGNVIGLWEDIAAG